jgi:hypothetical protein
MISRADTVNLSNMPVAHETEYRAGTSGSDPLLDKLLSSLFVPDTNPEKWKITNFETTPLVWLPFVLMPCLGSDQIHLVRCRRTLLRLPMDTSNTWKARTRVLLVARQDLYGSTVTCYLRRIVTLTHTYLGLSYTKSHTPRSICSGRDSKSTTHIRVIF